MVRILYQPRDEPHVAPYSAIYNLRAHSEDAGELERDFRFTHYEDRTNDRGHYSDSTLAHPDFCALND
jgi:hypothetical protein